MADDPKTEKPGAPALDDAKTEGEAEAGVAGGGAPVPPDSGDSPKPHGDKLENAVREATGTSGDAKP